MKIIIETKRFIIRELLPTDLEAMLELHSDPEVHIYLGNKTITSKDKITEIINFVRQQYIDFGVLQLQIAIMKALIKFLKK